MRNPHRACGWHLPQRPDPWHPGTPPRAPSVLRFPLAPGRPAGHAAQTVTHAGKQGPRVPRVGPAAPPPGHRVTPRGSQSFGAVGGRHSVLASAPGHRASQRTASEELPQTQGGGGGAALPPPQSSSFSPTSGIAVRFSPRGTLSCCTAAEACRDGVYAASESTELRTGTHARAEEVRPTRGSHEAGDSHVPHGAPSPQHNVSEPSRSLEPPTVFAPSRASRLCRPGCPRDTARAASPLHPRAGPRGGSVSGHSARRLSPHSVGAGSPPRAGGPACVCAGPSPPDRPDSTLAAAGARTALGPRVPTCRQPSHAAARSRQSGSGSRLVEERGQEPWTAARVLSFRGEARQRRGAPSSVLTAVPASCANAVAPAQTTLGGHSGPGPNATRRFAPEPSTQGRAHRWGPHAHGLRVPTGAGHGTETGVALQARPCRTMSA